MKKTLLAIPLAALLLWGCDNTSSDSNDANEQQAAQDAQEPVAVDEEDDDEYDDDGAYISAGGEYREMQEAADLAIHAYVHSQMQMELGRVAQERSQNTRIQTLGEVLVTDNIEIQARLKRIGEMYGIDKEPAISTEGSQIMRDIKSQEGEDFDRAFLELVIAEHKKDIERVEAFMLEETNTMARGAGSEIMELLQKHLEYAQAIKDNKE